MKKASQSESEGIGKEREKKLAKWQKISGMLEQGKINSQQHKLKQDEA